MDYQCDESNIRFTVEWQVVSVKEDNFWRIEGMY